MVASKEAGSMVRRPLQSPGLQGSDLDQGGSRGDKDKTTELGCILKGGLQNLLMNYTWVMGEREESKIAP